MSIFSNPWVIGIGGGLLSGLAVSWLSRYLFSQKDNKEYLQKVLSADQEVIYSLRPLISESTFPSVVIINSLISATSKRYKIDKKDMSSSSEFLDQLIKEVMDSSFVPNEKKSEYCGHLIEIKTEAENQDHTRVRHNEISAVSLYRNKSSKTLSSTIGLMVSTMTIAIFALQSTTTSVISLNLINTFLLPIGAALFVSLVALITMSDSNKKYELKFKKFFKKILP